MVISRKNVGATRSKNLKTEKFRVLALIPARAGSKRVKNKNIRELGSKPLIAYTIEAARASKWVDRVLVSTDGPQIAKIAKEFGAEAPFLRPKSISGPASTEYEFHEHALRFLLDTENYVPDLIVNLYPTSPFRTADSIDRAISLMIKNPKADSLRSVRPCQEHPYKMWTAVGTEELRPFISKKDQGSHTLSYQMLPKVFIQNASIYITRPRTLDKFGNTVGKKVLKFEMSDEESVDVNIPLDFQFAEYLLSLSEKEFAV